MSLQGINIYLAKYTFEASFYLPVGFCLNFVWCSYAFYKIELQSYLKPNSFLKKRAPQTKQNETNQAKMQTKKQTKLKPTN